MKFDVFVNSPESRYYEVEASSKDEAKQKADAEGGGTGIGVQHAAADSGSAHSQQSSNGTAQPEHRATSLDANDFGEHVCPRRGGNPAAGRGHSKAEGQNDKGD